MAYSVESSSQGVSGHTHIGWYLLAGILFAVAGFLVLDDYGATWDEVLGDFFFGNRYLHYQFEKEPGLLDFQTRHSVDNRAIDFFDAPFREAPWEFWPVASTLGALCSAILSRRFALVDPIDGFHAVNILLLAVGLPVFCFWLTRRTNRRTALLALAILLTMPRFVAHIPNNIKDMPETVFYTAALIVFFEAVLRRSPAWSAGSAVLFGLALGTKANAIFLAVTACCFLLLVFLPELRRDGGVPVRFAASLAAWPVIGVCVFYASWPYLHRDTLDHLFRHFTYVLKRGAFADVSARSDPLVTLILVTPILILPACIWGAIELHLGRHRSMDRSLKALLWCWVSIPLVRSYMFRAANFDGIRHFLEIVVPLSIMAALGIDALSARAAARLERAGVGTGLRTAAAAAIAAAFLLPGGLGVLRTHPFQVTYFNIAAGGLAGAQEKGLQQAGDYWCSSYRTGLRWLNEHAPSRSLLAVPVAGHIVDFSRSVWLRDDITFFPLQPASEREIPPARLEAFDAAAGHRPAYVMFIHRPEWDNALTERCRRLARPAKVLRSQGGVVLLIYEYKP